MSHQDDLLLLESVELWDAVDAIDAAPEPQAVAELVVAIQRARKALALAEDDLCRWLWEETPPKTRLVVRNEAYSLKAGNSRKEWDHDDLRRDAQKLIAERLSLAPRNVEAVLAEWTKLCGFQWKVTGVRDLGLDPDEYSRKSKGPPSLTTWG